MLLDSRIKLMLMRKPEIVPFYVFYSLEHSLSTLSERQVLSFPKQLIPVMACHLESHGGNDL